MVQTYYEILGVPRRSTATELKSAYRRKVAETHPDRADGRVDEFRSVCAAWDVLRDPGRRQEYDARLDLQFRSTYSSSSSSSTTTAGGAASSSTATATPPPKAKPASTTTETAAPPPTSAARPAGAREAAGGPVSEPVAPEAAPGGSGPVAGVRRVWRGVSRHGVLVGTLLVVFVATGGLGVWWIGDGGRVLALAAGVYVAGVAVVLGMRWWGRFAPTGVYKLLMRACWGLVALWGLVAAVEWVGHRDDVYVPVVVAAAFSMFGGSVIWLWRLAAWRFEPAPTEQAQAQTAA